MKNHILLSAFMLTTSVLFAQQNQVETDSTKTQTLEEVLVKSVRVKPNAPITHSNVTKAQLESRNLGQDLPILLNYLPSVVTTSDAGAGIGYTGIRVRGVSPLSTNVTINGRCTIGQSVFIGSGSVLRENLKIKNNSFIKMGSILKK